MGIGSATAGLPRKRQLNFTQISISTFRAPEFAMEGGLRAQMRAAVLHNIRGFEFADEPVNLEDSEVLATLRAERSAVAATLDSWDTLLSVGLGASTTDHPDQAIGEHRSFNI